PHTITRQYGSENSCITDGNHRRNPRHGGQKYPAEEDMPFTVASCAKKGMLRSVAFPPLSHA
ncbi:hypothetical protein, partial [Acetobacter pasteurianus]|uniref:hypothetical protein n=1 Tax=Acetobacter pasteurianus TaxID=438 RepID=UPI001BE1093D